MCVQCVTVHTVHLLVCPEDGNTFTKFNKLKKNTRDRATSTATSSCLRGIKHNLQLFKATVCKLSNLKYQPQKHFDGKLTSNKANDCHFLSPAVPPNVCFGSMYIWWAGTKFHNCYTAATNACVQLSTIIVTVTYLWQYNTTHLTVQVAKMHKLWLKLWANVYPVTWTEFCSKSSGLRFLKNPAS